MTTKEHTIISAARRLCEHNRDAEWQGGNVAPSVELLGRVVKFISQVIFPEYLMECSEEMVHHRVVINLEMINELLSEQITKALAYRCVNESSQTSAETITEEFIASIPQIKSLLTTDVESIFKADPAASSYAEIVLCYPTIMAMIHYRIAHSLHRLGVPIIPRAITELAHAKSGIDIHPGATIGSHFAIDHGTGVVIGETTIIGDNVVIYQGVTLGAKGFRFDESGAVINLPRHPIIEDNVRIYSNSSILGRITIGHDSIIGGNMWIDRSVEPYSKLTKSLSDKL